MFSTYYDVSAMEMGMDVDELLKKKRAERPGQVDMSMGGIMGRTFPGRALGALGDVGAAVHKKAEEHIPGYKPVVEHLRTPVAEYAPWLKEGARAIESNPITREAARHVPGPNLLTGGTDALQGIMIVNKLYNELFGEPSLPDDINAPIEQKWEDIARARPEIAAQIAEMPEMVDLYTVGLMGASRIPGIPRKLGQGLRIAEDVAQITETASGAADVAESEDALGKGAGIGRMLLGTLPLWSSRFRAFSDVDDVTRGIGSADEAIPVHAEPVPISQGIETDDLVADIMQRWREEGFTHEFADDMDGFLDGLTREEAVRIQRESPDLAERFPAIIERATQPEVVSPVKTPFLDEVDDTLGGYGRYRDPAQGVIDVEARDVTPITDERRLLELQNRAEQQGLGEAEIAQLEELERALQPDDVSRQVEAPIHDLDKQRDTLLSQGNRAAEDVVRARVEAKSILDEFQNPHSPEEVEQLHESLARMRELEMDAADRLQNAKDALDQIDQQMGQIRQDATEFPVPTASDMPHITGRDRLQNMFGEAFKRIKPRLRQIAPDFDWDAVEIHFSTDPDAPAGMFDAPGYGENKLPVTEPTSIKFNPQKLDSVETTLGRMPRFNESPEEWAKWLRTALEHELSHSQGIHDFPALDAGLDNFELARVQSIVRDLQNSGRAPTPEEAMFLDEMNAKVRDATTGAEGGPYYQDPNTGRAATVAPEAAQHTVEGQAIRGQVSGYDRAFSDFEDLLKHDPEVVHVFNQLEENLGRMGREEALRVQQFGAPAQDLGMYKKPIPGDAQSGDLAQTAARADVDRQVVEAAEAAEAPTPKTPDPVAEKLSWSEWVGQKYPDGIPKHLRRQAQKEYQDYAKTFTHAEGPKKGGPPSTDLPSKAPGKPKKKPRARYISRVRMMFGRTLANLEYALPKAGERLKQFVNWWEGQSASTIYDLKQYKKAVRALPDAKNAEQRIISYLDGDQVAWADQKELKLALEIRAQLRNIAQHAENYGVMSDLGPRKTYFPHIFEKDWAGPGEIGPTGRKARKAGGQQYGHLEKHRESDAENWIRNLDVLEGYADNAWRRISEAIFLGKKHQKIRKLVNSYDIRGKGALDPTRKQTDYIKKSIDTITQTAQSDPRLSRLRYAFALLDLPLAAIYQPAQATATAAMAGVWRSIKVAAQLAVQPKFRAAMRESAERSGALRPDVVMELAANAARTSTTTGPLKGFMWGIPTLDKAVRVHAFAVGEAVHAAALKGNKHAKNLLETLGFKNFEDPKTIGADQVGLRLSNKTQFRTGPAQKPLWASTEMGRFVWQYKHFAYHWGILTRDMFMMAMRGNPGPLVKTITIGGLITGEVVGDIRATLKGYDPFMDRDIPYDPDEPEVWLHAVLDRSRRVPISHPLPRILQNWFMIGGAGLFAETLLEPFLREGWGELGSFVPASRRPLELLEGVTQSTAAGDVEPLTRKLVQQTPVWGYQLGQDDGGRKSRGRRKRGRRQRRRR
jgi:hypothetical protein